MCLKREDATSVLKELFEKCPFLDGHYLALMPAGHTGLITKGYKILIKAPLDEETRNCTKNILKKYKLSIQIEDPETFIIYRPI